MFESIDRSRAHVVLTDLWAETKDPRRAAYATALSLYADHEALPKMLILAHALEVPFAAAVEIDFHSLMDATDLDADAVELVLSMAGAHNRGVREWTTAHKGENTANFVLTREEWQAVVMIDMGLH